MQRTTVSSESPWESIVGYSRAVRVGPHVHVSGTTASNPDGTVAASGDAYMQTVIVLQRIAQALHGAGAELRHVVRTRMYVTDISQWRDIARAHSEFFDTIRPAAAMVEVQALIAPGMLIEMEVDAIVDTES